MDDSYGKLVSKYTMIMDPSWDMTILFSKEYVQNNSKVRRNLANFRPDALMTYMQTTHPSHPIKPVK